MSIRQTALKAVAFAPKQNNELVATTRFPFSVRVLGPGTDKSDAFRLRHRAFAASGIDVGSDPDGFSDGADALPSSVVMLAFDGARAVGTVRACFSHPWQSITTLACAPYYPELAGLKRSARGSIVEIGRVAIDPDITNTSYRTTLYATLVRAGYLAALAGSASHILVTAKADAVPFYMKMLGFTPLGAPALYPPGDIPIALLVGTMEKAARMQNAQNSFFRITPDEIASLRAIIHAALIADAA